MTHWCSLKELNFYFDPLQVSCLHIDSANNIILDFNNGISHKISSYHNRKEAATIAHTLAESIFELRNHEKSQKKAKKTVRMSSCPVARVHTPKIDTHKSDE